MVQSPPRASLPTVLDLGSAAGPDMTDLATAGRAQDSDAFADTAELRADRRLTSDSVVVGSPLYMAPECWVGGGTADVRSDIYALGVLAYECLTGGVPFLAPDITALAR